MKATNSYSEEQFENFKKLASKIQELTVYGDEQTLQYMQMAKSLGISNENMEKVIKGAIGLSNTLGLGLRQSIRYVSTAMQGEFTILQRYVPALRSAKSEAEKMSIVQNKMAEGFQVATEEAATTFGQIEQFKNSVGDLQESLGKYLVPALTTSIKYMKKLVDYWNDLIKKGSEPPKVQAQSSLTQLSQYVHKYEDELKNMEVADKRYSNAYEMYMAKIMNYNKEWQKSTKKKKETIAGQEYTLNYVKTAEDYAKLNDTIKQETTGMVKVLENRLGKEVKITEEKNKQFQKTKEKTKEEKKDMKFLDEKYKWQYEHNQIRLEQYKNYLLQRQRALEKNGEKYKSTWRNITKAIENINKEKINRILAIYNRVDRQLKTTANAIIGIPTFAETTKAGNTEEMETQVNLAQQFASTMAIAMDPNKSGAESWKDILLKILNLLEMAAVASDAFNKAISNIFNPAGWPVILAAIATIEAAKAGVKAMSFAEGGVVDGPTLSLLGEAGQREFVTPEITFEDKFRQLEAKLLNNVGTTSSKEVHYHFDNPLTTREAAKQFKKEISDYEDNVENKTKWSGK